MISVQSPFCWAPPRRPATTRPITTAAPPPARGASIYENVRPHGHLAPENGANSRNRPAKDAARAGFVNSLAAAAGRCPARIGDIQAGSRASPPRCRRNGAQHAPRRPRPSLVPGASSVARRPRRALRPDPGAAGADRAAAIAGNPALTWSFWGAGGGLLVWQALLAMRSGGRVAGVRRRAAAAAALHPDLLPSSVYAYWG